MRHQIDDLDTMAIRDIANNEWDANLAYVPTETLNGGKALESYGHGECVIFLQTDPDAPQIALGDVALADDKDMQGRALPITTKMAKMLVAYVSRPDAVIPGMDTESELDRWHAVDLSETLSDEWAELQAESRRLDAHRDQYDVDVRNHKADFSEDWIRTGEGDCIELAAVKPDSKLRLIGAVAMRDSRFPESTVLIYDKLEMEHFAKAAINGEFAEPGKPVLHPWATRSIAETYLDEDGNPQVEYTVLASGFDVKKGFEPGAATTASFEQNHNSAAAWLEYTA